MKDPQLKRATSRALGAGLLAACLLGGAGALSAHARSRAARDLAAFSAPEGGEEGEGHEGRELVYKIINFVILFGALFYLLRKPAAEFFASRSAAIRKSLEEGSKALEASQAQLHAVEEKLARLESEIESFKSQAAGEMELERARLRQAAAEEAEKILTAARSQIELAVRSAQLELKAYTAQQALALAEEMIRQRLDDAGRQRLVSQFVASLEARERKN
ncbi:MAG: ATP synthase F0 subunit B [Acidobacteriia bacterium]|nr:ATP synthase F0 subunit B [Terriglobia bacterium]